MKRVVLIFCLTNICFILFANDTFFYIAGGNVVPAETNKTNVEMISEVINIDLYNDYYTVLVDFTFFNNGAEEKLLIGFPYLLQKQEFNIRQNMDRHRHRMILLLTIMEVEELGITI